MVARTEIEMAHVWCPESRVGSICRDTADGGVAAINRDLRGMNPHSTCLGSQCGAWRWFDHRGMQMTSTTAVEGWEYVAPEVSLSGVEFWREPLEQSLKRRRGFCGKAGDVKYAE